MKILLFNPPSKRKILRDYYCCSSTKANYYPPPIDLIMLSGILKGFDVSVIDADVNNYSNKKAIQKIFKINPDVIIFLTSTISFKGDMNLIKKIKENMNLIRLFGIGDLLLYNPRYFLKKYDCLEGIITNFSDNNIKNYFLNNKKKISGIIIRKDNKIKDYKLKIKGKVKIPIPIHNLFLNKKYKLPLQKKKYLGSTILSFGCSFNCSYCSNNILDFKERHLGNVLEEIKYMKKIGINEIYFRDYTLHINKKIEQLFNNMIKEKINMKWFALTRAELLTKKKLLLMKKSGCRALAIGIESSENDILREYNRKNDFKKITKVFDICNRLKITTLAYFMVFPKDTKKTISKNCDFIKKLNCDFISINFYVPRTGSKAREALIKKKKINKNSYNHLDCSINSDFNNSLTKKELIQLRNKIYLGFYFRFNQIYKILKKTDSIKQLWNYSVNSVNSIQKLFLI